MQSKKIHEQCLSYFLDHFDETVCLQDLCQHVGRSAWTVNEIFKAHWNMTPIRWLWLFRTMVASQSIVLFREVSLTEIAHSCGFNDSAHFCRCFKLYAGLSPRLFRSLDESCHASLERFFQHNFSLKNRQAEWQALTRQAVFLRGQ